MLNLLNVKKIKFIFDIRLNLEQGLFKLCPQGREWGSAGRGYPKGHVVPLDGGGANLSKKNATLWGNKSQK